MALKSETASPPNGMVNVINQESGGGADDLEDGEIFDDDDEVPVPAAIASPPAPPPPPTISLIDDKRRLSPLRRQLPTRPRRPKRVRDDERPFRNSKQRRRSDDNEKREKNFDDDDLLRDISPLRGSEWDRVHHRSGFMDDGMEDDDDDLGRRGRGFGNSRSRRGRNNRGGRRGGGRRENSQPCKFFLLGKCQRGSECPFSHSQQTRKFELCKFYMMDCCAKKDKCLFMHSEFPCKYHYLGKKCYAGKKCKFSHGKITSQLRVALLRDSKECDFLQEKEDISRSRRDRDRDRDRDKDREHRDYRDREKRDDKDKLSLNYKSDLRIASDDEEGNRTPMPSPSQDNSSDRDSRSRTPELEDQHSDHSNKSDAPLPDPKDSGIGEDITDTIPADLPKRQRELYKRIQQQQREVESVQSGEGNEEREEDYKEEDWYSSEDEDSSKKMEPLAAILNKLKQKPIQPVQVSDSQSTTGQSNISLSVTSQPTIIVPPIFPDFDVNAVSKLLSSVRETIQQKQNIENQNRAQAISNSATVSLLGQPPPPLPPLGSLVPDTVPSVEKRRVRDPRLRGSVTDDDVDLRMAPQGDVDLRQLPFKPAPVHTPANEIDASITSHPPVPYKLIPIIVAPPDYSDITSKYVNDPRLRRNNPGAMMLLQPALMQPVPLRPTLEPRDPRQRGLLANDPRRKSSVLLQRDSDLRQPPHHFPQLGDVDLRMHPPTPHLAFK